MTYNCAIGLALAATVTLAAAGCTDALLCAEGTIEADGECVAGGQATDATCGPGTHLDPLSMMCVPDLPPTVCDEDSTIQDVDADGVTVCVGTGGAINCDRNIPCPTPTAGAITACGRFFDLETGARLEDAPLDIAFYDALAFAANPDSPQLPVESIEVDSCGRFAAVNVDIPFNNSIGIAVRDADGAPNDHVTTGVALFSSPGEQVTGIKAYAARHDTDINWTMAAGDPFGGATFSDRGVFVTLFRDADGNGVPGVRVVAGGTTRDDGFYFTDADNQLTTVDPDATITGSNGAALLVDAGLAQYSGRGGEPAGCAWSSVLAAAIPGVVFVQERELEAIAGGPCE